MVRIAGEKRKYMNRKTNLCMARKLKLWHNKNEKPIRWRKGNAKD